MQLDILIYNCVSYHSDDKYIIWMRWSKSQKIMSHLSALTWSGRLFMAVQSWITEFWPSLEILITVMFFNDNLYFKIGNARVCSEFCNTFEAWLVSSLLVNWSVLANVLKMSNTYVWRCTCSVLDSPVINALLWMIHHFRPKCGKFKVFDVF